MNEEDTLLAAELVFGLLDRDARAQAEAREASDAAFAAEVALWRDHVAGLLDGHDEAPRPSLWSEINARIPANDVAPPISAVRRWQWASALAAAAAIALGIVAARPLWSPPPTPAAMPVARPPMVAMLTGDQAATSLAVTIDPVYGRLTTTPRNIDKPGKSAELWVIPADGVPRSLGLVPPQAPQSRSADRRVAPLLTSGVTLAVSLEQPGGSPSGKPAGPVILTGKLAPT